jgi:hypothetical protein
MGRNPVVWIKDRNSRFRIGETMPSRIGIAFLIAGVLSLILSISVGSQVLALVGLGLTFWGALFSLLSPVSYVESRFLGAVVAAFYANIDRLIADLKLKGSSYYVPPLPVGAYVPEHLKGLRETVVFVSAKEEAFPPIEELAKGKFLLDHQEGALVSPPGMGLLQEIDKETQAETVDASLNEMIDAWTQAICENFNLAKDIRMTTEEDKVTLITEDSLFKKLYIGKGNYESVKTLGCPIVSAIACLIARAYNRPVTIRGHEVTPDGLTIRTIYQIERGQSR